MTRIPTSWDLSSDFSYTSGRARPYDPLAEVISDLCRGLRGREKHRPAPFTTSVEPAAPITPTGRYPSGPDMQSLIPHRHRFGAAPNLVCADLADLELRIMAHPGVTYTVTQRRWPDDYVYDVVSKFENSGGSAKTIARVERARAYNGPNWNKTEFWKKMYGMTPRDDEESDDGR